MKSGLVVLLLLGGLLWGSTPQAQDTRVVYLSPIDGDGSDATPYHARCYGMAGAGNIDLRPYGFNRYLCASNALPANMTGVIVLGNSLVDSLSAPRRAALEAIIGKSLSAATVDRAVVEILISKIRAGRDGKLKIYLGGHVPMYQQTAWLPPSIQDGGLVADATNALIGMLEPAVAWATIFATETFTCADNASLTCVQTWTEFQGTDLAIVSNAAKHTGATQNEARIDSDLATDDMEVSATLAAFVAADEARCGVLARKDSTATRTFYTGHAANAVVAANSDWRLAKRNAGALSSLGSNATDPVAGDVMTLRPDGTNISLSVNGTVLVGPVTDATISGNVRAGLVAYGNNASDSCTLDAVNVSDHVGRSRGGSRWLP